MLDLEITFVKPDSRHLQQVKDLADQNTETLGLLPYKAYDEYAAKNQIIGGLLKGELVGFIVFRIVKRQHLAKIAYFCIDQNYRGHGASDGLFAELVDYTKTLRGIGLLCRRDYKPANALWKRLGFVPKDEEPGRGKEGTYLTYWWYDHGHKTIFDLSLIPKVKVAIDANIFFDFEAKEKNADPNSRALLSDWLSDEIELVITPELRHEINRITTSHHVRKKHLQKANNFREVQVDETRFRQICKQIEDLFPHERTARMESDLRQIAYAIADPEINFFVTRDADDLLSLSDAIFERFGLTIQHPVDLILRIDEYARMDEYRQMRLAGTNLNLRRVQSGEQNTLAKSFQYDDIEKRSAFLEAIRSFLVERDSAEAWVVETAESKLLLLVVYEWSNPDELQIPIFRINRAYVDKTLVRYWLLRFMATSAKRNRVYTRITEPHLTDVLLEAMQEDTFVQVSQSWLKPTLELADTAHVVAEAFSDLLERENRLKPFYKVHLSVLEDEDSRSNTQAMSEIERLLWPVKIIDAEIQTWSIPINSTWAALWFDEELATQTLWGANKERAFNREGIYYSGSRRTSGAVPGRVLWYVTKQPSDMSSIRACSRLDDIIVGPAKELFRQFRHLGIYEWQDLKSMINNNLDREITAFRFSDTQMFNHPVSFEQWRKITQEIKLTDPPIYSPSPMPREVFTEIYRLGMKKNDDD